jgi:AraC-like DNA-binding protein
MANESASQNKNSGEVKLIVENAHVKVATEVRGKPVRNFSCRELPLAKLELFDIVTDPVAIYRRQEDIDSDGVDHYLLATQVKGSVLVNQGEADFTQHPGDLSILEAGTPYSVIHTQNSHRLILHIPQDVYQERILSHAKDRKFRPRLLANGGLATIIHEMLKTLAFEAEKLGRSEQYTMAECMLELTSSVLRSEVDHDYEQQHAKQSALFRRILEFMESNYTDCELTPEKVADANGISVRYLHSLFNQAGLTVSKWIWDRRLKATREDLLDPNLSHMRVSQIAFQRGFNDPAHFSRAFKSRFDISPSKLRQVAEKEAESAV